MVGFVANSIDAAFREQASAMIHIGGRLYACVKPRKTLVKLEYLKKGLKERIRKGVTLSQEEWTRLKELMETVGRDLQMDVIPPCLTQDDYRCIVCYPYAYDEF